METICLGAIYHDHRALHITLQTTAWFFPTKSCQELGRPHVVAVLPGAPGMPESAARMQRSVRVVEWLFEWIEKTIPPPADQFAKYVVSLQHALLADFLQVKGEGRDVITHNRMVVLADSQVLCGIQHMWHDP
jgi:hypothetical protein